jgi:hypothetical protein
VQRGILVPTLLYFDSFAVFIYRGLNVSDEKRTTLDLLLTLFTNCLIPYVIFILLVVSVSSG